MSFIHRALSQANKPSEGINKTGFNPLERSAPVKKTRWPHWLFAITCLVTAATIVLWPNQNKPFEPPQIISASEDSIENLGNIESADRIDNLDDIENLDSDASEKQNIHSSSPSVVAENISVDSLAIPIKTVATETEQTTTPAAKQTATQPTVTKPPVSRLKVATTEPVPAKVADTTKIDLDQKTTIKTKPQTSPAAQTTTIKVSTSEPTNQLNADQSTVSNSIVIQSQNQWKATIEAHIKNDELEQAEQVLKQWIGVLPNDSVPRMWLARIYISVQSYYAAEPLLGNINSTPAKALLGLIYERTQRPNLAAEIFEILYRANPIEGKWLLFWAINTENSQQLAKSKALYQNYLSSFINNDPTLTIFAQQRLKVLGG